MLNPEDARLLPGAGWSEVDVQEYLWRTARNSRASLTGRGVKDLWPTRWADLDPVPIMPGPNTIHVVVAGTARGRVARNPAVGVRPGRSTLA